MLALILAVSMELCPICGNYDAAILVNGGVQYVHMAEDATPGSIYTCSDDSAYDTEHWTICEYMGYIY